MPVSGHLDAYRSLLDLTRRMLDCAHREDIDALERLEAERVACIAALPAMPAPLPAAETAALRQLLLDIQACDAEVLAYLQPWRSHLEKFVNCLT